ncbi:MAG: MFS transporter, partial [Eubacteriaceae bacterium]|nr:MFS transporter [Eubacteriaceae bacterium]
MNRSKKGLEGKGLSSVVLFMCLCAAVSLAAGFSDSVFSNFFKDAYAVSASQRAFIEFPREAPGLLCVFVISALGFLGDIRLALIAQILSCIGVTILGFFTPSFALMLIFLFLYSLGQHIYLPLTDSIGMSLSEPGKVGTRMGQFAGVKTACSMIAAVVVFFGFRGGLFTFKTNVKLIFLIAALLYAAAAVIAILLYKRCKANGESAAVAMVKTGKLILRKEYRYYYMLTVLYGVQKQIAFVFGSWVIIDILSKGADIMSLLSIIAGFLGIFFIRLIGKWMDKFGVKTMLFVDALSFIFVYTLYGAVVWGMTGGKIPMQGWPVFMIYALFILDRLSMQTSMVRSVYLRSIAIDPAEVTRTLSTGTSLDHVVAIISAQLSGLIWKYFGPQWVFFMAAFFSLGNL